MLRPLYANERSVIPSSAGIPEKPAFFINAAGRPMNESQISNRIVNLGKRINPQMSGNLRGSRIRKGIITMQRKQGGKGVTDEHLAKQMSHSVSTAQQYYNIEEQVQSDIRVASFLSTLTGQDKEEHNEDYEGASTCFVDDRFVEPISPATPAAHVLCAPVSHGVPAVSIDEGEEGASIRFIDEKLVEEVKVTHATPAAVTLGADGDEGVNISFIHNQSVKDVRISRAPPAVDVGRGKQMENEHNKEDRHTAERGEPIINQRGEENVELTAEQKKELVRIYQNYLIVGRVPPKQIYNQKKIGNKALKNIRFEHAAEYLQKKIKS